VVAGAAVVGATALAIGAIVASLPDDDCRSVVVNGRQYFDCHGDFYRPRSRDDEVVYEVVDPPY
jgi:hypothetical protein